mmetsp:Transcript_45000/g.103877  ORF Transcript_45000/g.103877 Transcript_45000/m.103877 type:complete len:276 (-) Transcript_45000:314-1141(-)
MSRRRALEARTSRCSPDAPPRCASTGTARMTAPSAASSRARHSSARARKSSTSSITFARWRPSRGARSRSRPQTTALPLATRPRASRAAISRRARAGRRSTGPSYTSAVRAASFRSSRRSSWSGRRPSTSCSRRLLWNSNSLPAASRTTSRWGRSGMLRAWAARRSWCAHASSVTTGRLGRVSSSCVSTQGSTANRRPPSSTQARTSAGGRSAARRPRRQASTSGSSARKISRCRDCGSSWRRKRRRRRSRKTRRGRSPSLSPRIRAPLLLKLPR